MSNYTHNEHKQLVLQSPGQISADMASTAFERPKLGRISANTFSQLLASYDTVVAAEYGRKLKSEAKVKNGLEDDQWRYNILPGQLSKQKRGSQHLSKEDLVRLNQWKITHGTFRPFLPGMIAKNDASTVETVTQQAFSSQAGQEYDESSMTDMPKHLDKALRKAAELHGVGPATATLLCSVYDPVNVPFFEDELYEWVCPGSSKLKYSWAEYKDLFLEVRGLRERLGFTITARDIEKVGYVLGHMNVLEEKEREMLLAVAKNDGKEERPGQDMKDPASRTGQVNAPSHTGTTAQKPEAGKRPANEDEGIDEDNKPLRKSKRTKK